MPAATDAIERAWRAGRAAYRALAVPREVFGSFLSSRSSAWLEDDARAVDLFLACACICRVPNAAETFMAAYVDRVPGYLRRRAIADDLLRDVQQQLAVRLLVAEEGKAPLLESYTGRGSLEAFVRVAASRIAVDLQRRGGRKASSLDAALGKAALAEDLELKLLKEAYREPFRVAFAAAIRGLAREHRGLLRLHYVEGMTTEQLARLHRIGRATVVRRLRDAREKLVEGVQEELRARHGIAKTELEGLLRVLRSQIDLSLNRLLRETMS